MKPKFSTGLLLAASLLTCGCAAGVIAVGAAVGIGSAYVVGEDTRTYDVKYDEAVQACRETLGAHHINVIETRADESKTTIYAQRADDTPVQIEVQRAGPARSMVGVRTGRVGISEREASKLIHAALKERLLQTQGFGAAAASASPTVLPERPADKMAPQGALRQSEQPKAIAYAKRAPPELTIYFAVDSNALQPGETAKLDRLAEMLQTKPEVKLALVGYTDALGSSDYNRMIASGRASAVKLYFVAKGVNPHRISVDGRGARDFVAGNDSEEGRSLNRRVEIKVIETR